MGEILREIGAGQGSAERVTRAELLRRVRSGDVIVVDVRPAEEFEAGHILGALSVPLEHLELVEVQLGQLDPDVEVVAYCRGPLCLLAPQAVAALRDRGRPARCLEDGMPEWRQAGLPVAFGAGSAGEPRGERLANISNQPSAAPGLARETEVSN